MSIIYKILPKICSHVYKVKASKHKKISIHSLIASIILFVIHTYSVAQSYPSHGLWPIRLLCPLSSPGNNTGVGCHFLLQGIFLTQGRICVSYVSSIGMQLHYQLHHLGSHLMNKDLELVPGSNKFTHSGKYHRE